MDWEPGPLLQAHLDAVAMERSPLGTPEALRRAEAYAAGVFRSAGLVTFNEAIAATDGLWHNIVADTGTNARAPLFIIGAHLDTVEGSPGADDNASGLAALLALADWVGKRRMRPWKRDNCDHRQETPASGCGTEVTVRLVAFNLEEWGMLGSREHARTVTRSRRTVEGMISLEMIGYADTRPGSQRYPPGLGIGRRKAGDFIAVVGNRSSRELVQRVSAAFKAVEGLPVESISLPDVVAALIGASLSDHSPFWAQGHPALMVGDTAFYRNPHYHRGTDTVDTLSLPFLERVTRGLALVVEPFFA
jgi:Zn-dependent M28 family amino/carboxypeptidase